MECILQYIEWFQLQILIYPKLLYWYCRFKCCAHFSSCLPVLFGQLNLKQCVDNWLILDHGVDVARRELLGLRIVHHEHEVARNCCDATTGLGFRHPLDLLLTNRTVKQTSTTRTYKFRSKRIPVDWTVLR